MHRWRLWTVLTLIAPVTAGAAIVYKWIDANGVVHFSDQAVPGAETIVTASGASNGIGGSGAAPGLVPNKKPVAGGLQYNELTISSPVKEQVFFNDDVIPIRLQLDPELKPHQSIAWHLNGRQLDDQAPDAMAFALQTLPRGTYVVAATVTDLVTGESQTSDSVTFYVRQPSELAPQHKKS